MFWRGIFYSLRCSAYNNADATIVVLFNIVVVIELC